MITKLPDKIIKKIAAGEVITCLSNIVKELLENAIDAKATSIIIQLEKAQLTISDTGSGILESDFDLLCEPHCTSKLSNHNFIDIQTYGFRGEALYSISMCSDIYIETKTQNDDLGWGLMYSNGKLQKKTRIAVAKVGTMVNIQNIFKNNFIKKYELTNSNMQYKNTIETIRAYQTVYYNKIQIILNDDIIDYQSDPFKKYYSLGGTYINDNNYKIFISEDIKKNTFILFINGRLVRDNILKKHVFKIIENKMIFIELQNVEIDVNIHPSKAEVMLNNKETIIEKILHLLRQYQHNITQSKIITTVNNNKENITSLDKSNPTRVYNKIYTEPAVRTLEDITSDNFSIKLQKKTANTNALIETQDALISNQIASINTNILTNKSIIDDNKQDIVLNDEMNVTSINSNKNAKISINNIVDKVNTISDSTIQSNTKNNTVIIKNDVTNDKNDIVANNISAKVNKRSMNIENKLNYKDCVFIGAIESSFFVQYDDKIIECFDTKISSRKDFIHSNERCTNDFKVIIDLKTIYKKFGRF